jgi:hypothetical protein
MASNTQEYKLELKPSASKDFQFVYDSIKVSPIFKKF